MNQINSNGPEKNNRQSKKKKFHFLKQQTDYRVLKNSINDCIEKAENCQHKR